MKILTFLLTLTAIFLLSSCLHTTHHKVFDGEKPQICIDVFDAPPSYYPDANKLNGYTVENLITLNKCEKEYSPQISLNLEIMNHPTYPVHNLLSKLKQESSDEFRFCIIETLTYIPEFGSGIYKYDKEFKKDKREIVTAISNAVSING